MKMIGVGSQYAVAYVSSTKEPLDGSKTDRLHLLANIPVKDFWSLVHYDNQAHSMLQIDQHPSIGIQKGVVVNANTSADIYFGPKPPLSKESNWVHLAKRGMGRNPEALRSTAVVV
ncbi:DUF1214 domain-containing protein [Bradyrhizobium lablabi]|uniref:DUF1214 domain-containing protein n=1 Tax=Bradyrhizobium lablabi TaxID=722472 RepID=UPI001BA83377|nr:DUF1214 domain-containing protein [Bradyrhizobium lablabi]MBR0693434.1 DUF1214 domain-containing protein [Bradyrhizobium lablabi]